MAIFPGSAIPSGVSAYEIDNSLRSNYADTPYLEKVFGATSTGGRKIATISFWLKLGDRMATTNYILDTAKTGNSERTFIQTQADSTLRLGFFDVSDTSSYVDTQGKLRDPSAWYHIVAVVNTPHVTASSRLQLYVNGELQVPTSSSYPDQDDAGGICGDGWTHQLLAYGASHQYGLDGYLAEFYCIDGQALTADSFGETSSTTNQWIPKDASDLTFGTNGFYQKYDSPIVRTSFTASTTWTVPAGVTSVDYLVVGGAGGGGGRRSGIGSGGAGGGGGSGGYRTGTLVVTPAAELTVTIGDGGAGGGNDTQGVDGASSVLGSITSGGGGGGGKRYTAGSDGPAGGGSGGGGGGSGNGTVNGGSGSTYGNDGGSTAYEKTSGGGGGSTAVGGNTTSNVSGGRGAGGAGTSNDISGSAVTYGVGGAGGFQDDHTSGANGAANTGNGGGGAMGAGATGGTGGSGIVVIKYGSGFGADSSGEDNDFTATNLVATDQMVDTPTNNFCTWNPLWGRTGKMPVLSEGNLVGASSDAAQTPISATFAGIQSGKWYWEIEIKAKGGSDCKIGLVNSSGQMTDVNSSNHDYRLYLADTGNKFTNTDASTISYGNTYAAGDIVGIALDMTNGALYFSKNNTWQTSGDPTSGASKTGAAFTDVLSAMPDGGKSGGTGWVPYVDASDTTVRYVLNAGSDSSFAGEKTAQGNQDGNQKGDFYYTPPTDYLALCTDNLSDPEIALPGDNFNTVLYTGTGSELAITGAGFQPDFTWIKTRELAYNHRVFDVVRGVTKELYTNDVDAEVTDAQSLKTFDSDGFTLGTSSGVNPSSSSDMVSWNWLAGGTPTATNVATTGVMTSGSVFQDGVSNTSFTPGSTIYPEKISANTTNGFSIVMYTGTGATGTLAHGLSAKPELIWCKNLVGTGGGATNWGGQFEPLGPTKYMHLDTTGAAATASTPWNDTAPTASLWTIGTADTTNNSGEDYIAYLFHSVEGYSKIGSYEGNGNADGTFIYTGFKPAFVLTKQFNTTNNWYLQDSVRNPYNEVNKRLNPNLSDVEYSGTVVSDYLSNGFKLRHTDGSQNTNGGSYLYLAFASSPFKTSNAR